ncbi:MAG: DUF222 domain-containing protein [Mycobacteriales bacterium]
MYESGRTGGADAFPTDALRAVLTCVQRLDAQVGDAERVDQIELLEQIKSAAAGAQARVSVELAESMVAKDDAAGVPQRRRGQGLAGLIGFARHESPHHGARHLTLARALVGQLPKTYDALCQGRISEWRAAIVVTETAALSDELREAVDAEIGEGLGGMGDRKIRAAARAAAYRLDPAAAIARTAKAERDRRVTLRPAPDTMVWLSALLPVAHGVAAHAALEKAANSARATGDPRSRDQVRADTLIERITGQETAEAVPVEIGLVMDEDTMWAGSDRPGTLAGYGQIPADLARRIAAGNGSAENGTSSRNSSGTGHTAADPTAQRRARAWLRRLYTRPSDGSLVRMDSRRRVFDGALRDLIVLRDQSCRSAYCDAPIRHADHPVPVHQHGQTTASNGQGLCEACNYAKEARGWHTEIIDDGTRDRPQTVRTTLPTGHSYDSLAPPPLPPEQDQLVRNRIERIFGIAVRPGPHGYQKLPADAADEPAPDSATGA